MVLGLLVGCRSEQAVRAAAAQSACERISTLCQGNAQDKRACEDMFASINHSADADNIARTGRCVAEARTCGEASGCVAGGAARAGAGFLREFTNGFTR
jgi:hypothetical protein